MEEKFCTYCACNHPLTSEFWYKADSRYPRCKLYRKEYSKTHREEACLYKKAWYKKHKDKCDTRMKEWRDNHKEYLQKYFHDYQVSNRDRISRRTNEYNKKRRKSDIEFRLATNLRRRLNKIIRSYVKVGSHIKDLGCTLAELKHHLESKFQPEMNWDNYGTVWSIDHIMPLANFDLTDKEQLKKAVHFSNLQPLFVIDNIRKSNKVVENN
jgi:hypothetical protein